MKKATEDLLIAFSLHEGLNFPQVKKIFQSQSQLNQRIQLADMKKTITLNPPKTKLVPTNADLAVNDTKRSGLESPTSDVKKKDD